MSVYILGSDDPNQIRRFAGEVAPAVRQLVAAERGAESRVSTSDETEPTGERNEVVVGTMTTGSRLTVVPTPDDGIRLIATTVWDESTRPSSPAYDDDRHYTAHDTAVAQHLIDIHDHLRDELMRLRDLMEQVIAGSVDAGAARSHINTMTIRQNKWTLGTYCESYCRVVTTHHSLEDYSMLPHLRRADPALVPVVDRLQEEHVAIHDVLEGVDRALVAFVSGPDAAKELQDAVALLSDTLLSHLSYEERELVEPLARFGLA
jgi:hypothetical protein